ncbi:unnamed protein product [Ambrosiozyma monospora]|uniref:Unnamed protein product n=1 Tax=Ambrosiozyma monospora TaxID=43982 RepID=A0ACB5TDL5_AMBMO|nr:unnamed protein product [Ambrosiozyma monospora]
MVSSSSYSFSLLLIVASFIVSASYALPILNETAEIVDIDDDPFEPDTPDVLPSFTYSYTKSDLPGYISYYSQLSSLTYCVSKGRLTEEGGPLSNLCTTEFCQASESIHLLKIVRADVTALILEDEENQELIVAFKGTTSHEEWMMNINYKLVDHTPFVVEDEMNVLEFGCVKPKAHRGFRKGYESFHNTDAPQFVIDFMNRHSDYRLIICGHSLGGAMAQFAGLEFYLAGLSPTIFTYGAPKAFNKNLALWIDSEFSSNFVGGVVSNRADSHILELRFALKLLVVKSKRILFMEHSKLVVKTEA